jgi:hypothetical protein
MDKLIGVVLGMLMFICACSSLWEHDMAAAVLLFIGCVGWIMFILELV